MRRFGLVLLLCGWTCQLLATDFYVGGANASDNNSGTAAQPFATIQKAADVARSGDVVKIRSGTYRETIVPANSGVTFESDNGANVIISGLQPVVGTWTLHSGNIYKISINLPAANNFTENTGGSNTVVMANQIFQDGEMQHLARWPDVSTVEDLFDRTKFRPRSATGGMGVTSLTDGGLPPNLTGAWVSMSGWILTQTRQITAHSGSTISYAPTVEVNGDHFRQFYYVTGKLSLLTQAKEWHYENGTLYLWQRGGGVPANVEYKARNFGFDLRNKTNTTVRNITFKGCDPVTTTASSTNTVVDNIRATYLNHSFLQMRPGANYFYTAKQAGLKLLGANSVLKNSELSIAGAHGVWLGTNTRAENNLVHTIAYDGMWGAAFMPWEGNTSGQVITKNTMHTLGRSGINLADNVASHLNMDISYNDIYNHTRLNLDNGAIYGGIMVDLTGTRIHHNWFHDIGLQSIGPLMGLQVTGVYLDQASGPVTVDHNVNWGGNTSVAGTDFFTEQINEHRNTGGHKLYNNVFWSTPVYATYVSWQTRVSDVQRNNIYNGNINIAHGANPGNIANAVFRGVDPQFVGSGGGGLNFRIRETSPARNAGVAVPGITDGSIGAPDIGAYEYGGENWVAGYKAVPQASVPNAAPKVSLTAPAANATFAQGAVINLTATASDDDGTVTRVEFFNGNTKIGEDLTNPYAFSWTGAPVGTLNLTARATDDRGATTTSARITITVTATENKAPTVAITAPASNASVSQGNAINVTATAADSDGTIAKVEFFNGTTKLGEDTSSPYTYTIASAAVGTYAFIARATDDKGAVTNSATVNVTVTAAAGANKPPVVAISSPANSASFQSGAVININATASDSDGTVTKVEFFNGTTKLGEDTSSPYTFSWTNASVGAHTLTAKATDNSGAMATSTAVNVVVTGSSTPVPNNTAPTIAITAPTNGTNVRAGDDVQFVATATDTDGTVTLVEFFEGSNKIGEADGAPYSIVWTPTVSGDYSITAVATDDKGATTVSAAIRVVVNAVNIVGGEATDIYGSIPRFFSPNGDGNGDTWVWADDARLKNASVEVRNRAGELVYRSNAYDNSWDGKVDGKQLQDGEYFYIARLTDLTVLRASLRIIR